MSQVIVEVVDEIILFRFIKFENVFEIFELISVFLDADAGMDEAKRDVVGFAFDGFFSHETISFV